VKNRVRHRDGRAPRLLIVASSSFAVGACGSLPVSRLRRAKSDENDEALARRRETTLGYIFIRAPKTSLLCILQSLERTNTHSRFEMCERSSTVLAYRSLYSYQIRNTRRKDEHRKVSGRTEELRRKKSCGASSSMSLILLLALFHLPTSNSLLQGTSTNILTKQGHGHQLGLSRGKVGAKTVRSDRLLLASIYSDFENGDAFAPPLTSRQADELQEIQELRQSACALVHQNHLKEALTVLKTLVERLCLHQTDKVVRMALSEAIDGIVQTFCAKAFRLPTQPSAVIQAVEAVQLQLSSTQILASPYSSVPKRTLIAALDALTSIKDLKRGPVSCGSASLATKLSFRILQRLVTGVGVRRLVDERHTVSEREINKVLNFFSNQGRMDMAHRIVALQERSQHAPALSAVAYSILLKGYGKQSDLTQVEEVLDHARKNGVEPDVILLNTLIDAYNNCNDLASAKKVFNEMRNQSSVINGSEIFPGFSLPRPNRRTYNIMLKGLANDGKYHEAVELSDEMGNSEMWDPVTTNTLVCAAVIAKDFDAAERILAKHTIESSEIQSDRHSHPNVEAYTQLLDAYAKSGNMNKALAVIQTMAQRDVHPNTVTYTCLIAGLGRTQRLDEAKRMLAFMTKKGLPPSTVTYNALISALIEGAKSEEISMDIPLDQSLTVLRDMMNSGVRPNSVTAAVLVEAMGCCEPGRIESAILLVEMLKKKKILPVGDVQVATALIRACGLAGDLQTAVQVFRKLKNPDLVAINAFMDTCHRCDRPQLVVDTFNYYFLRKPKTYKVSPDLITYSVLINSSLKNGDARGLREAQSLYYTMKKKWAICPDTGMVDTLLKAVIHVSKSNTLIKRDIFFVAGVLRDAERLSWQEGQLERRKRAIRSVLGDRLRKTVLDDQRFENLFSSDDDELFRRKGWNKVDSGFRLWGQGSRGGEAKTEASGDFGFLESHGWNDVNSGFRFL